MRKTILFIAALVSLVSAAGCRRVVILSFNAPELLPAPDRLFVRGINPPKAQRELTGLGQTIGYYDVSASEIEVRVTACAGGQMLSDHQGKQKVVDDEVTIQIGAMIDADPKTAPSCRGGLAKLDGGSDGELGGAGGGAGGDADGGAGADAAGDSGAAGNGGGGAGVGGAAGTDGGTSDSAECGTDTHGPVCELPSGDAAAGDIPTPPTISADCMQYCSDMQTKCPSVYASNDSCQRYCALAGWAGAGPPANSLECRNQYLSTATPMNGGCANTGPVGNAACGYPCRNFCDAWIGICKRDPSEASACLTACTMKMIASPTAEPTCRFRLLERALYDQRYCAYVQLDSCFSCE